MDLSVRLPTNHPGLIHYYGPKYGTNISPTDELSDWLMLHGRSLRSIERDQAANPSMPNWDKAGMTFHFTDLSEALLFKLTWL